MEEDVKIVQEYYDSDVQLEWNRLEKHPFEFILTTRMMDKYIKPGDYILDIGGGPGRYSLHYAEKGCNVTLVDLSSSNVKFALEKATEQKVSIKAVVGDAREVERIVEGEYDHVFLMGPMYHLLEEKDRIKAMNAALSMLKPGGQIYVSFILLFAGIIYEMKYMPEMLLMESDDVLNTILEDKPYTGDAFTKAFFIPQKDIIPFMEQFPIEKMHLFGQESILAPCETNLLAQSQPVIDKWIDFAEQLCERESFLSYSEHAMYIGRKSLP